MTRKEEIARVADENYSGYSERRLGFIAGANWADKTMLDRACEWLRFRVSVDVPIETNENGEPLADVCAIYVSANITTQLSSANNIQQCINNVQTNLQQVDNVLTQRLNINFKKL